MDDKLIRIGLWLAKRGGWQAPPMVPGLPDLVMARARRIVREIERQGFGCGEAKRHHALRAMLNHHPAEERACGLAIELAVAEMD